MLKWFAVWILLPILIVAALTVTASFLRVPVPAEEHQNCLQAAQEAHEKSPDCPLQETVLRRGTRDPVAYYTLWLTAFTGFLAVVGIGQGLLASQQIRLARDEFDATHRPRIAVRGFRTLIEGVADEKPSIMFVYVNVGDLPARIIEIGTNITISGALPFDLTFKRHQIHSVTLSSGDKEVFHINEVEADGLYFHNLINQIRPPSAIPSTAYVTGYIIYDDESGRRRETGFCRMTANGTHRWVIASDSEYEYQD